VGYLTNTLGSVLDFINGIATTISEKFTGDDSGAALVVVIFYLVALILILLLFKGVASITKDLIRVIFYRRKKKKVRVTSTDNSVVNSNNENNQATINDVETFDKKKRTKDDDDLSLIKNFGNKKYIDDLSLTFNKINEFDNCGIQSQHITNKIPLLSITSKDNIVLSETDRAIIKNRVKDKSLNELKDLLKQANIDEAKLDNAIVSLNKDLSLALKERDKLAQQELAATEEHNNTVDSLAVLCDELTKSKSDLLEKYSELLNFITNLGEKKAILLDSIKEFKKEISSVSEKNKAFASLCDKEFKNFARSFQQKEELLAGCKKNYILLSETRNKKDEDISALQEKQSKAATDKALHTEFVSELTVKIEELTKLEQERLAREEAERKAREEAERKAKEEAERLERERLAKLEAERLEKERIAKEEAERLERERLEKLEAERLEKERLAKLEAERLEKERLAKEEEERIERERQKKLEAERLEKERLAKLEAERLERERLAKMEAERLERERLAKEEALKKQELETKDVVETQSKTNDASESALSSFDSDEDLNEIKEQIKRQQQNSYFLNFDNISPEMLERMALAEKKKRMAAKKAAQLNGKSILHSETKSVENKNTDINKDVDGPISVGDEDVTTKSNEDLLNEDKPTVEVKTDAEDAPQTDYFSQLKQQWAEEEANKKRWAEEKARIEEERQRRKKELAEKLSGNGFSDDNE